MSASYFIWESPPPSLFPILQVFKAPVQQCFLTASFIFKCSFSKWPEGVLEGIFLRRVNFSLSLAPGYEEGSVPSGTGMLLFF